MNIQLKRAAGFVLMSAILAGCGGDGGSGSRVTPTPVPPDDTTDGSAMVQFEVSVVNLTAGQPLSPIALVAHSPDFRLFELGDSASAGMELLAEGGDNSELLTEVTSSAQVAATAAAEGPLGPGGSSVLTMMVEENDALDLQISLISMLVNTNDAITAVRNLDVSQLDAGDTLSVSTISYDTGTEANSELSGTIPGPVDGGEGFNAERDDIADAIRGHSGVVTLDGGLGSSILTDIHRWDNPVARITVTRLP